jgi:hypothetical protein
VLKIERQLMKAVNAKKDFTMMEQIKIVILAQKLTARHVMQRIA